VVPAGWSAPAAVATPDVAGVPKVKPSGLLLSFPLPGASCPAVTGVPKPPEPKAKPPVLLGIFAAASAVVPAAAGVLSPLPNMLRVV
jgi:hypothetical protein